MEKIKTFNVRISKDLWLYVKKAAIDREMTLNALVANCLSDYKNKREKKLTAKDDLVE